MGDLVGELMVIDLKGFIFGEVGFIKWANLSLALSFSATFPAGFSAASRVTAGSEEEEEEEEEEGEEEEVVVGRDGVRTQSCRLAARARITSFLWAGTPTLKISCYVICHHFSLQ